MGPITTLTVRFVGDATQLRAAVAAVQKEVQGLQAKLTSASGTLGSSLGKIGANMQQVGSNMTRFVSAPAAAGIYGLVDQFGQFEMKMNRVAAVSDVTGDELKRLENRAVEMGMKTRYTSAMAADAMGFLAQAGFDANQMFEAMPMVMQLAAAANMDVAKAADISTNIVYGYGLEIRELGRANDVLTMAMNRTNTDLTDLGVAFKYAGPVLKASGIEFEEAAAALGLLGNAGFQGSIAGTGLRQAMARLLSPTNEMNEIIERLGLNFMTADGKVVSIENTLRELQRTGATAGDVMELFGVRAGPQLLAMLEMGPDALAKLNEAVKGSEGIAAKVEAIQMKGIVGELRLLKSAVEAFFIEMGRSGALDLFSAAIRKLTKAFRSMAKLPDGVLKLIFAILGLLAVLGPLFVVIGGTLAMAGAFASGLVNLKIAMAGAQASGGLLSKVISGMTGVMKAARTAASNLWRALLGPVGIVIGVILLLVAAFVLLYKKNEAFRNAVNKLRDTVVPIFKAIGDAFMKFFAEVIAKYIGFVLKAWSNLIAGFMGKGPNLGTSPVFKFLYELGKFIRTVVDEILSYWDMFSKGLRGEGAGFGNSPILNFFYDLGRDANRVITFLKDAWFNFSSGLKGGETFTDNPLLQFLNDAGRLIVDIKDRISEFYNEHKDTFKKIAGWIGKGLAIGSLAIVGAVIAAIVVAIVAVVAVIAAVVGVIIGVAKAIMFVVNQIKNFVNNFRNGGDEADTFGGKVRFVFDRIVDVFNKVKARVEELWYVIKWAFREIREAFDSARGKAGDIWSAIREAFDKIKAKLAEFWEATQPVRDVIESVRAYIAEKLGIITDAFGELKESIKNRIAKIAEPLRESFDNVVDTATAPFRWLWNKVKDFLSKGWAGIKDWFANLSFKQTVETVIDGAVGPFFTLWDTIKRGAINLYDAVIAIKNFAVAVVTTIINFITAVKDFVVNVVTTVYDFVMMIVNFVTERWGWVFDAAGAIFDMFWAWIKMVFSNAWDFIKMIFWNFIDFIKLVVDLVVDYVAGFIRIIAAIIDGDWARVLEIAKELNQKAWDKIMEFIGGVVDRFKEFIGRIVDNVKEFGTDMKEAAQKLGDALKEGLSNALSNLGEVLNRIFVEPFKKAFDKVKEFGGGFMKFFTGSGPSVPDLNVTAPFFGEAVGHRGGVVPGKPGTNVPMILQAGEGIIPSAAMRNVISAASNGGGGGGNTYAISVNVGPGGSPAEVGRQVVEAIRQYERRNGKGWRAA